MTTPVGSIRIDMSIDGSDLWADVASQIAPVLAGLEGLDDRLNRIERGFRQTGRESERSSAQQTRGLHAATRAAADLADKISQVGVKAVESSALAEAAVDQVTRAWERQTRAIAANTAARTANSAAPTGGPPGGRNPGFGMATPRSPGGGGSKLLSAPILNLGAVGAASLPAAATAVVNLAGAIQALGQAGLVLPGVFGGIAASAGTTVLGLKGMGDAIKALNDAASDPAKLKDVEKTLKDLAPAGIEVAKSLSAFTQGPLKDLQKAVQQPLLAGVSKEFDDFVAKSVPRFQSGMVKVAGAQNGAIKELLRVGGSDSTGGFIDRIFGNTADAQSRVNKAIEPLVHAFGTLAATGSDFLPRLADGLTKLSTRFDDFITKADAGGRLAKWINEGFEAASNFGTALLNIGKIITDLTGAAGGDGGFLKWLADVTGSLHAFLSSTDGQNSLRKFFAEGKEKLGEFLDVIRSLLPLISQVVQGFQQWGDILLPVIQNVADALTSLSGDSGVIAGVVTAFLAFKTLKPFAGLLTNIGEVNTALGAKGGGGLLGKLSGLKTAVGVGGAGLAISGFNDANDNGPSFGSAASTIGGAALAGGALGSVVPGIGTAFGAFVGGLGGAVVALGQFADAATRETNRFDQALKGLPPSTTPAQIGLPKFDPRNPNPQPNAPRLPDNLRDFINSGQAPPGFVVNPDGTITGPNGSVLPGINVAPRAPAAPLPAPFVPPGPVRTPSPVVGPADPGIIAPTDLGGLLGAEPGLDGIQNKLDGITASINELPPGQVDIKDNTAEVQRNVDALKKAIANIPPGSASIVVTYMVDGRPISLDQLRTPIRVAATPGGSIPTIGGGRAGGGVLPGYSPGVDNMLVPMSGGEGVLIPEAVRALGGGPGVYALNSRFRSGLSRKGYAGGGVVGFDDGGIPHLGTGALPGPDDNSVTGLLVQIRDLLAGKGGSGAPLNTIADNISTAPGLGGTSGTGGTPGTHTGPFGTPVKNRNLGYEAAAAAIGALGGNAEAFLGPNPIDYFGAGGSGAVAGVGGAGTVDLSGRASALSAFAKSGSLADAPGLDSNDPVIRAIISAREKKKGGLDDDAIASLVQQIVGGSGYTGTLDSSNSSLAAALQTYRDKQIKAGGGVAGVAGAGTAALPGSAGAIVAAAQAANGGQYQFGASDLAAGLSDCTGAISDLVEIATKGQADSGRLFSTGDAASVLTSLGAVPGLVPGALQIGFKNGGQGGGHAAATLPNGVNFESGGGTGQGATYGGLARGAGDPEFTDHFSLPVSGAFPGGILPTATGLPGPNLATAGAPVPVYIVNGPGGAIPGQPGFGGVGPDGQPLPGGADGFPGQSVVDAGFGAVGDAASNVAGDFVSALGQVPLPGTLPSTAGRDNVPLAQLLAEGNPAFLASAFKLHVPDLTRQGGENIPNTGSTQANGQITSDTSDQVLRTLTDLQAQTTAGQQQTLDILNQVKDRVAEEILKPLIQTGVQEGFKTLGEGVATDIGNAIGNTAGPLIATAVSNAAAGSGGGGGGGNPIAGAFGLATGGGITGPGTGTSDSILARVSNGEWVTKAADVRRAGGFAGMQKWTNSLPGFATGGGVNVNATVGADFFGVAGIPIIGAIVNALVSAILKVLGVEIEARDTLNEVSANFRQFRGDFKEFDARGRLFNDTSGLTDRTSSSEKEVADERLRILKIVIQALVKYIIEKVIVPIAKAVANAAIQAGASAAGAATNVGAPGAGGIVSSFITSAGGAGVDIAGEVGTDLATSFSSSFIDLLSNGLTSAFPDIFTNIFGGGFIENLFINPIGSIFSALTGGFLGIFGGGGGGDGGGIGGIFSGLLSPFLSIFGGGTSQNGPDNAAISSGSGVSNVITSLTGGLLNGVGGGLGGGLLGGLLSPLSSIFEALTGGLVGSLTGLLGVFTGAAGLGGGFGGAGGGLFDSGGVATGIGYMPKAVLAPERVLSARQNVAFEQMVRRNFGDVNSGNKSVSLTGGIHLHGTQATPEEVHNRLLALLG